MIWWLVKYWITSNFHFLNLYTVDRIPWTGDQPVARTLPTHRTTQTRKKRTQTSMTWMEFEPTIPAFERAKTVRPLWSASDSIQAYYSYPSVHYYPFSFRFSSSLMWLLRDHNRFYSAETVYVYRNFVAWQPFNTSNDYYASPGR
jgi:hypothetical protein